MAPWRRGPIDVRRDVESRPAFEVQLLAAISGSLDRPRDARIERRSLQRSAEHCPGLVGYSFLTFPDVFRRGNRVDHVLAPCSRLPRKADEVPLEIVGV